MDKIGHIISIHIFALISVAQNAKALTIFSIFP